MKKKLLSLLLALAMVFTLVACGEKKPAPGKDATATEPVVILTPTTSTALFPTTPR